jgi:MFS family permease
VPEPIIPLGLFRSRTVALASIASVLVGSALYGVTVFLSQYFQVARLKTPTMSGLYTIPLVLGMFLSSLLVGRIITRTGRWKVFLVAGSLTLVTGFAVLATTRSDTPYAVLAVGMFLAGSGMGATMQNLVLAVQNSVSIKQIGSASAAVSFLRSLGGAIGVSVLGAVLASQVAGHVRTGLSHLGVSAGSDAGSGVADPAHLPGPVAHVVEQAYGIGTGWVFGVSALAALLGALVIPFIRETPLRTSSTEPDESLVTAAITVAAAEGVAEDEVPEDEVPEMRELARV